MHVVSWIESEYKLQVDVEARYSGASSVEARCDRPYLTGIGIRTIVESRRNFVRSCFHSHVN